MHLINALNYFFIVTLFCTLSILFFMVHPFVKALNYFRGLTEPFTGVMSFTNGENHPSLVFRYGKFTKTSTTQDCDKYYALNKNLLNLYNIKNSPECSCRLSEVYVMKNSFLNSRKKGETIILQNHGVFSHPLFLYCIDTTVQLVEIVYCIQWHTCKRNT